GGVGTDPNSMAPMALLWVSGYLALVKVPVPAPSAVPVPVAQSGLPGAVVGSGPADVPVARPWWDRVPSTYLAQVLAAVAAVAVVLVGAVPMAAASVNPNADP